MIHGNLKQDQKCICPSPLTTVQCWYKVIIRSYEVDWKGRNIGSLLYALSYCPTIVHVSNTCIFPALTGQSVCCEERCKH